LLEPERIAPEIEINKNGASIRNGKIHLTITRTGIIVIRNQHGKKILEEYIRNNNDQKAEKRSLLNIEGREFKPVSGGDYALTLRLESLSPDEKIFGMGQYQQPYLNHKGCTLELAQRNSQASVPFMISSLGYGFLWNNPAVGRVTFGKNLTIWEAYSAKKDEKKERISWEAVTKKPSLMTGSVAPGALIRM
jgi:alpha-D-xyloside xylohydrolase